MIKSACNNFEMIVEPCIVYNDVFRCIILRDNLIVNVSRQHLNSIFAVLSSDSLPCFLTVKVDDITAKFDFQAFLDELEVSYDSFFTH